MFIYDCKHRATSKFRFSLSMCLYQKAAHQHQQATQEQQSLVNHLASQRSLLLFRQMWPGLSREICSKKAQEFYLSSPRQETLQRTTSAGNFSACGQPLLACLFLLRFFLLIQNMKKCHCGCSLKLNQGQNHPHSSFTPQNKEVGALKSI